MFWRTTVIRQRNWVFSFDHFFQLSTWIITTKCIDELKFLFGDKSPSYSTVKNWFNEFNPGRSTLNDEFREGPSKTAIVPENIDAVCELITQDRHVIYRKIEASLGISFTSIRSILHEYLAVKTICSRWIPQNLISTQKRVRVDWCKEMLEKLRTWCFKRRL